MLTRHPRTSIAALLALAIGGTFGVCFGNSMFMAAADSVHRLPLLSGWQHLPTIFSSDFLLFSDGKFRPLSYGLIAVVRSFVDADSLYIWHLLFLLIHWANAILVSRIVEHFAGGWRAPLFAGLLFAVHPLATVIVNDAGFLHHLLTPTIYLAVLSVYLRSEQGATGRTPYAALGLFALGLLVSKVLFTLPVLLLAYEVIYQRSDWRRLVRMVAPLALTGLVVSPLWWLLKPHPLHFSYIVFPPGATWFTLYSVISAVEWYARGLLLGSGIPVNLREAVPQIYDLASWRLAALTGVMVAVLASGFVLMRRRQWGGIGILAMVVVMLPFASTTWHNVDDYVAWKYLYMPLAGLSLSLAWAMDQMRAGRRRFGVLLWLIVPLFAWQQISLNVSMTSPEAYWSRVKDLNPESEVAHVELGKVYLAQQKPVEARAHLFAPAVKQLYASASAMCRYYAAQGQYLPAAIHLRMALRRGQGLQFGHGEPLIAELMHTVRAYDHAEAALGKVLTSNPYDLAGMERLVAIWSDKGYVRAAEELHRRVRELDPSSGTARRIEAILTARHDGSGEALAVDPPTPSWLRYATQGTPDAQTQEDIIRLSDDYQDDPIVQLEAAACLARSLDYPGALVRFERVTQTMPNSVFAWAMRAWTAAESGKMDEAVLAGRRAMELDNRNATVHNTLGILAARRAAEQPSDGSLRDLAIKHFQETLRLDPLHTSAYVNLGKELARRGDTERAMALYRRAVRLRPDFPEGHFNMGNLLASLGNHDEAVKSYKLALRARHDYVEAYFNQGISEAERQDLKTAALCFFKAVELRPTFTRARDALATSLMQQGAYRECLITLQQGLKITPQHWRGAVMLASLLTSCPDSTLRDPPAAVALAGTVSKRFGHTNPDVLLVLAGAQAEAHDLEGAIGSARRALGLVDATQQPKQAARA
ncbi:MAG: tetratricopeptide repeat protein, partial [Gemmatimonadetes bacterium]|nr:tetratricopeptide repeat protein [Gemmatimonadota bacterium]